jgi:hypothetical protein
MGGPRQFLPPVEVRWDRRQRPLRLHRALVREDREELLLDPRNLTVPVRHQAIDKQNELMGFKIQRVESKRVDKFANTSDEELRQYVYGKELDS